MNKTQLDINIAQKIVGDNSQYRFLRTLLPLYVHFRKTRRASSKSELTPIHGWVARYVGKKIKINRETFYLDEKDFVVQQRIEEESAWYLGLRGCDKPDDLINFNHVKKISPHALLFYGLDDTVPEPKNAEYLKLGN